jgi:hypothetical protein
MCTATRNVRYGSGHPLLAVLGESWPDADDGQGEDDCACGEECGGPAVDFVVAVGDGLAEGVLVDGDERGECLVVLVEVVVGLPWRVAGAEGDRVA